MGPAAFHSIVRIALWVGGIAAYHLLVATAPAGPAPTAEGVPTGADLDALTGRIDAIRAGLGRSTAETPEARAFARLAAVERALVAATKARPGTAAPVEAPPPRRAWTTDQIAALEAVLDEINVRNIRTREETRMAEFVTAYAPGLVPARVAEVAGLLADFFVRIRAAYDSSKGYGGYDLDADPAVVKSAGEARVELEPRLRALLPKDAADLLLKNAIPVFPAPDWVRMMSHRSR